MLRNRLADLPADAPADDSPGDENPVTDPDFGFVTDFTPETLDRKTWSDPQKRQFSAMARELDGLAGPRTDAKLNTAAVTLSAWLREGLQHAIEQLDQNDARRALRTLRSARNDAMDINYDLDDPQIAERVRRIDTYLAQWQAQPLSLADRKLLRSGLLGEVDPPAEIFTPKD